MVFTGENELVIISFSRRGCCKIGLIITDTTSSMFECMNV